MTAEIKNEDLNNISIIVIRIKLTFVLFIRILGSDIKIKRWNEDLLVRRRHYCKSTNCQEAEAGANRIKNNSLLLIKEFNYRLYIKSLYLLKCLPSHLILP